MNTGVNSGDRDTSSRALLPGNPSQETPPNGAIEDCVREAIATMVRRPDRDADNGRFVAGTPAAWTTGATSRQLKVLLRPAKAAIVDRVRVDLGLGADDGPETLLGLVDAYAEARLIRQSMFEQIAELGGPITGRGRTRALVLTYFASLDKEIKLAQVLGLERRARPALGPLEYLRSKEEQHS